MHALLRIKFNNYYYYSKFAGRMASKRRERVNGIAAAKPKRKHRCLGLVDALLPTHWMSPGGVRPQSLRFTFLVVSLNENFIPIKHNVALLNVDGFQDLHEAPGQIRVPRCLLEYRRPLKATFYKQCSNCLPGGNSATPLHATRKSNPYDCSYR